MTLGRVIDCLFELQRKHYFRSGNSAITDKKLLKIPINTDTFEIPTFAFPRFIKHLKEFNVPDILVAELYDFGEKSSYKSIEAIIKDIFQMDFSDTRLCKVKVSDRIYYAASGAIFSQDFIPLAVTTWKFQKENIEGVEKIIFKGALLHVAPRVFLGRDDTLLRFLTGKMLNEILIARAKVPFYIHDVPTLDATQRGDVFPVNVEIAPIPFQVIKVEPPSISSSNKDLLQIAIDNIENEPQ